MYAPLGAGYCEELIIPAMRQKVGQNKIDFEAIRHKLAAIVSTAEKYKQRGSLQVRDRRAENLSTCVVLSCFVDLLASNSLVPQRYEASHRQDPACTTTQGRYTCAQKCSRLRFGGKIVSRHWSIDG
jgi:hypothetical protein